MSEENSIKIPSIEELKKLYKERLDGILYRELTPKNITTFAEDVLNDLIVLNEEILDQYKSNPVLVLPTIEQNVQEQENDAYTQLELLNIQEILGVVDEVRTKIKSIEIYIENEAKVVDAIITPPEASGLKIEAGSGSGIDDKKLVPRLVTLVYLLETDLGVNKESATITSGIVTDSMMRKTPYVRVEIPELDRVVYICDEESNATYIFNTEELEKNGLSLDDIDIDSKVDKNDLIKKYHGIGIRIIQTKNWRRLIFNALSNDVVVTAQLVEKKTSEFIMQEWLPFEEFKVEVTEAYETDTSDKTDIRKWYISYRIKNKKEKSWPGVPGKIYNEDGWAGFRDCVGKKWLSFEEFKIEVMGAYETDAADKTDVKAWYRSYRTKNGKEKTWPSHPDTVYQSHEFTSFREFFSREWLSFEEFKEEVTEAYETDTSDKTDIRKWYRSYRIKNNKKLIWPGDPPVVYKESGWKSFLDLVGKK